MKTAAERGSADAADIAYYFTGRTLIDGSPIPEIGKVELCRSGFQWRRTPWLALEYAPGCLLHRVQIGGEGVSSERTIIASIDAKTLCRRFACDQALSVAHLWDMPPVVREYLTTMDVNIRAYAEAYAWDAALSATWSAAEAAARSTEWSAALSAAWAVARAIARGATWSAARAAARAAARSGTWSAAEAAAWDAATRAEAKAAATWSAARSAAWSGTWAAAEAAARGDEWSAARAAARATARSGTWSAAEAAAWDAAWSTAWSSAEYIFNSRTYAAFNQNEAHN